LSPTDSVRMRWVSTFEIGCVRNLNYIVTLVQVPFFFELRSDDPLLEEKMPYWIREGNGSRKYLRLCVSENDNTRIAFSLLRFIVADQQELDMLLLSNDNRQLVGNHSRIGTIGGFRSLRNAQYALSIKNEILMWKKLLQIVASLLSAYPATYDQDVALLADTSPETGAPMFSNKRNALIQVKGEKEVLLFYKEMGDTALAILQTWPVENVGSNEFYEKMEDMRCNQHFIIYNYCKSVAQRLLTEEKRKNEARARNMNMALPTVV
jgi:hypothetical protein